MSYSAIQSVLRETLVEKIGAIRTFKRTEVISSGSLYILRPEAPFIATKRLGILTRDGLHVIKPNLKSMRPTDFLVDFRINVFWSQIKFSRKPLNDFYQTLMFPFQICFLLKNSEYSVYLMNEDAFFKWKGSLETLGIQSNFHEKFAFNSKVGNGAVADVYKVWNNSKRKFFACKIISRLKIKKDPTILKALVNEITILRKLKGSPHFACLEEVFETQDAVYLVMELIEGGRIFDQKDSPNCGELLLLIKRLVEALVELAKNGIVHRDLKPDNILLRSEDPRPRDSQPVIIDFGLAVFADSQDYLYGLCGTRGYVSPEVYRFESGDRLTPKADVFSLGVVLFNYFTQTKPLKDVQRQGLEMKSCGEIFDFRNRDFRCVDADCGIKSAEINWEHARF